MSKWRALRDLFGQPSAEPHLRMSKRQAKLVAYPGRALQNKRRNPHGRTTRPCR